jgi:quinol monooxygenase YgiN
MIIYEVNLAIDNDIADAYTAWLRDHIREILAIDGFIRAEVFAEQGPAADVHRIVVHYHLHDMASLERYFADHAPRLRADAVERFGDRFTATRRVLQRTMEVTPHAV